MRSFHNMDHPFRLLWHYGIMENMNPGRSHSPLALPLGPYCPFTFFRRISSNCSGVFFARMSLNWVR